MCIRDSLCPPTEASARSCVSEKNVSEEIAMTAELDTPDNQIAASIAPSANADPLFAMLAPTRLTAVVDIGASPVGGVPPYKSLLRRGLCRLFGFEPQEEALKRLNAEKSELETYLPYVVGDGKQGHLRICLSPGMTSLLEPDEHILGHFPRFSEWGRVLQEIKVPTRCLDDIGEIDAMDFLKIDVQGSELAIFRHGRRRLARAVVVQAEVSFIPLYKKQPVFAEVDLELRARGFVPHALVAIDRRMIRPMFGDTPHAAIHQLLEADAVYVRDFTKPDAMDAEQLKHLAIVAHHCYGSYDLAMNCVQHLVHNGALRADAGPHYLELARMHRAQAAPVQLPAR